MSEVKRSLILIEHNNFQNSIDLLEVVHQIYTEAAYETYAVSFDSDFKEVEGLFDYLIKLPDDCIASYDVRNMTNVLEELQEKYQFDIILFPATQLGRMVAPSTAMRLQVGLVADVTAIRHNNGTVEMIRPAFGGKIMARIINRNHVPLMMSVRQNVFTYEMVKNGSSIRIEYKPGRIEGRKIELLEIREKEVTKDIRESEILISGGGGVTRYFNQLKSLADELNAQVSASRKIVDGGVAPRSIQVGQSGKTVSPKLYMAMGISGSLQHIEGLKNVENIISVNTDKNAPICSLSDIVVEGDAREFIEKLIEKIKGERD